MLAIFLTVLVSTGQRMVGMGDLGALFGVGVLRSLYGSSFVGLSHCRCRFRGVWFGEKRSTKVATVESSPCFSRQDEWCHSYGRSLKPLRAWANVTVGMGFYIIGSLLGVEVGDYLAQGR